MIEFVNAKINVGLNIVGKRDDGYHLLQTVFYPVGKQSGTPVNPEAFCDIMELTERKPQDEPGYEYGPVRFLYSGAQIDCSPEKNLVCRGVKAILDCSIPRNDVDLKPMTMRLEKHLPAGAGMGGGSADCVAAMRLMRDKLKVAGYKVPDEDEMCRIAAGLGADCPMFVANSPAYAEGIGEVLTPLDDFLSGNWLVVVKPDLFISTAEAFAGVTPRRPKFPLLELIRQPIDEWKKSVVNDFEVSLFPKFPELRTLKDELYSHGAHYASLTGSGAALYGIFSEEAQARQALSEIHAPYKTLLLL